MKINVHIGDVYGRLTILEEVMVKSDRYRRMRCICECGVIKVVSFKGLRNGMIKSCGCLHKERVPRTHRLSEGKKHPLYLVWRGCYNPRCRGARGIKVCEEWREHPEAFVSWALKHGWQPNLTINREDNDRGYEPSNCTFISKPDNNRHRLAIARKERVNIRVLAALSLAV